MKILVTGASGFLGSEVVRLARGRDHQVRAFVRPTSDLSGLNLPVSAIAIGDLHDGQSLIDAAEGIDAVIHCAAETPTGKPNLVRSWKTNVTGTENLIGAFRIARSRPHWIQISSMSAHEGSTSVYGITKLAADEAVRKSGFPWTILRPSIIYGPGDKGLVSKTVKLMRKLPVMPVVGPGTELIRPVLAADVAAAALDCLASPATVDKTYMIGGADEMTLNNFLVELGRAYSVGRPVLHLPIALAMTIARMLGAVSRNPPLTVDNVLGVKQAQRVDISQAIEEFGFNPIGFEEGLNRMLGG